jgi:hypothetical protein
LNHFFNENKIFYFPLGLVAKIWLIPPGGLLPVMPTIIHHKKNSKNTIMFCTLSEPPKLVPF